MNSKKTIQMLMVFVALNISPSANAAHWTFHSSMIQAMSASPELKKSAAMVGARQADLQLSTMWPDPNIELRIDNQLGQDTGSGNYELAEISISQDIPLSRIQYQKSSAQAKLSAAKFSKSNDTLLLQNKVAKIFHELQLTSALYQLAQERVELAIQLTSSEKNNNPQKIVRYLTPIEKMRLGIIRESAHQAESAAQTIHQETLTEFSKLLVIDSNDTITVPQFHPLSTLPELIKLAVLQDQHPVLSSQQQKLQAASSEIDVARSSIMKDPTISFSRLRENFSSGTENVYGIMLNLQIPIHDHKSSVVSKANYNASQQRIELARLKYNLKSDLKRSFFHLNRIIKQASDYQIKVLMPARKMLTLSEKGFISGELNILSLIDANNTYFDSYTQYLNLIYQSRIELADVNLYAGNFITQSNTSMPTTHHGAL